MMKRSLPKAGAKKTPAPAKAVTPEPEALETASARTVTLTRGYTVQTADGQFAKCSVSLTDSLDNIEDMREQLSELASQEVAAAVDQLREFAWDDASGGFAAGSDGQADADDEGEADPDIEAADDDIGPDQIRAMKRDQLIELVTENGLDIDPNDYPKTPKGLNELREAIVAIAEASDEGEADEGDAEDDAEGTAEGDAEITVEDIQAMNRPALVKLIEDNGVDVDPAKYPKISDLRNAVIEFLDSDDDGSGDDSGDEGDGEGGEIEEYTRETLATYSLDDLKAIYTDWGMGPFPKGAPPPVLKKNAITAILKAQAGE